jgi:hypothetical protein
MKKQEIMDILLGNNVTGKNVKTFASKHKQLKNCNIEQLKTWLVQHFSDIDREKRKQQTIKDAKSFKMSLKQYKELRNKAAIILHSNFDTGHSMGCYKTLKINNVAFYRTNNAKEYAKGCKYKPVHGYVEINLTKKQLIEIEELQGVWTVKGKNNTCLYLHETGLKHTYKVELIAGYLFGESHGKTFDQAKKLHLKKRQAQIDRIKREREQLAMQIEREQIREKQNQKFICVQHLREVGACYPGIESYIRRNNLNPDLGYNVGYLRSIEDSRFFDLVRNK